MKLFVLIRRRTESALASRSLGVRRLTVNVKQPLGNVTAVKYSAARSTVMVQVRGDAQSRRTNTQQAVPQRLTEKTWLKMLEQMLH